MPSVAVLVGDVSPGRKGELYTIVQKIMKDKMRQDKRTPGVGRQRLLKSGVVGSLKAVALSSPDDLYISFE